MPGAIDRFARPVATTRPGRKAVRLATANSRVLVLALEPNVQITGRKAACGASVPARGAAGRAGPLPRG